MVIRRLGDRVDLWATTAGPLSAACLLTAIGCAHHRADQYAYAPPYAPPVYPQPPVQMPAQPAATVAAPGVPAAALPPGAMLAGAATEGTVVPAVGGECPPCTESGQGVVVSSGVMPGHAFEAGNQTPPCPPGP